MPSWLDGINDEDETEIETDGQIENGESGGAGSGDEDESAAALTLEDLETLSRNSPTAKALWADLLALRQDRETEAAARRDIGLVEKLEESGDWGAIDPGTLRELIRVQVESQRSAENEAMVETRKAEWEAAGWSEEDVERWTRDERDRVEATSWFWEGSDPLNEHAAYQEHVAAKAFEERSQRLAIDTANRFRTLEDDVADAQAGIRETVDAVISVAGDQS